MNKKEIEKLQQQLIREPQLVWDCFSSSETKNIYNFSEGYKQFLDSAKTEREAVVAIVEILEKEGFKNIENIKLDTNKPQKDTTGKNTIEKKTDKKKKFSSTKVYKIHRGKALAMAVIGKKEIKSGVNIIASHIDSPRLDLKQQPLYEDLDIAFLKTHYYGGIRKYQWLTIPLALHGRIVKSDGSHIDIIIGESDDDPVFTVSDLLPHLAGKLQNSKKLSDVFEGEKLNLITGSIPVGDKKTKDRFKLSVLKHLFDKYQIVEEDLISAELEAVPAGKARDIGIDRSMIGAYGQDDKICAFTSLQASINLDTPETTAVSLFFDKEEIGSEGNAGAKSRFIEEFISDLLDITDPDAGEREVRECLIKSTALSADVNAALDPDFKEVHEEKNAGRVGYGVCITKFTGVGGKSGSSDASAELLGKIRQIFNKNSIVWQTGELGKIDQGGGGTIAKFLASYGMEIVDCGPAILSMHSPMEVSSKADVYMVFKAYEAFFKSS